MLKEVTTVLWAFWTCPGSPQPVLTKNERNQGFRFRSWRHFFTSHFLFNSHFRFLYSGWTFLFVNHQMVLVVDPINRTIDTPLLLLTPASMKFNVQWIFFSDMKLQKIWRYTCSRNTLRVLRPLSVIACDLVRSNKYVPDQAVVLHHGRSRVRLFYHPAVGYRRRQLTRHFIKKKDSLLVLTIHQYMIKKIQNWHLED